MIGPIQHDPYVRSSRPRPIGSDEVRVVEPSWRARPVERRSQDALANGVALRLGIAAQIMTSDWSDRAVLPLSPATRAAARYAGVSEGFDRDQRLGFSRTL